MADELETRGDYRSRKLVLARGLDSAGVNELVILDKQGRVVDARSVKARFLLDAGMGLLCLTGFASMFYVSPLVGGAIVLVPIVGIIPAFSLPVTRLRKGLLAKADGRFDEAIDHFQKVTRSRLALRGLRAGAARFLVSCLWCKGNAEGALAACVAAKAIYAPNKRMLNVDVRLAMSTEVLLLVELDHVAEARGRLDELVALHDLGEYIRLGDWFAQLYVCMAEGRHPLAGEELHHRTMTALRVTSSTLLLGLLSWAHHVSGDDDQAWHLLREAYDREWPGGLQHCFVRLRAWMQEHAELAGASVK